MKITIQEAADELIDQVIGVPIIKTMIGEIVGVSYIFLMIEKEQDVFHLAFLSSGWMGFPVMIGHEKNVLMASYCPVAMVNNPKYKKAKKFIEKWMEEGGGVEKPPEEIQLSIPGVTEEEDLPYIPYRKGIKCDIPESSRKSYSKAQEIIKRRILGRNKGSISEQNRRISQKRRRILPKTTAKPGVFGRKERRISGNNNMMNDSSGGFSMPMEKPLLALWKHSQNYGEAICGKCKNTLETLLAKFEFDNIYERSMGNLILPCSNCGKTNKIRMRHRWGEFEVIMAQKKPPGQLQLQKKNFTHQKIRVHKSLTALAFQSKKKVK